MKGHNLGMFLVLEMVARCIKNDIRKILRMEMKEFKRMLNKPYIVSMIQFLNLIFCKEQEVEYWNYHLRNKLKTRFEYDSSFKNIRDAIYDVTINTPLHPNCKMDGRYYILKRIQMMTGLKFTRSFNQLLKYNPKIYLNTPIFDESDLSSLKERIKPLDVISFSTGYIYK